MLIDQAGCIGRKTKQGVQVVQGEQGNAGNKKALSSTFLPRAQWIKMNPAPLENVLSHKSNTDKNYGLQYDEKLR